MKHIVLIAPLDTSVDNVFSNHLNSAMKIWSLSGLGFFIVDI